MSPGDSNEGEFVGGPRDGLRFDVAAAAASQLKLKVAGRDDVPLILHVPEEDVPSEGQEVELVLLGVYVREGDDEPARYRWFQA